MIARIAYLTSPAPNVFTLNIQPEGQEGCLCFEISKAHLTNILIDGASLAFRESNSHRVPEIKPVSAEHERAASGT